LVVEKFLIAQVDDVTLITRNRGVRRNHGRINDPVMPDHPGRIIAPIWRNECRSRGVHSERRDVYRPHGDSSKTRDIVKVILRCGLRIVDLAHRTGVKKALERWGLFIGNRGNPPREG
jgi:hypothetical protein